MLVPTLLFMKRKNLRAFSNDELDGQKDCTQNYHLSHSQSPVMYNIKTLHKLHIIEYHGIAINKGTKTQMHKVPLGMSDWSCVIAANHPQFCMLLVVAVFF